MARKPKPAPPDSLPPRDRSEIVPEDAPDVVPDDAPDILVEEPPEIPVDDVSAAAASDAPFAERSTIASDALPLAEETAVEPLDERPDGGVSQHPIHDDDQEDLMPEDYEGEIDEVEVVATRRGHL